jgi:D-alanyl-D-alanine carboxypeptidase
MDPSFEWCGGGFVTTSADISRFLCKLHGGDVISKSLHDQQIQALGFRDGQPADQGYGLGSFVWLDETSERWFGHAGLMPGYLTQAEYSETHRFALTVQVNTDQGLGRNLHQQLEPMKRRLVESLK